MPWTISGPGQPLHVPGKSYPQLAATALMAQEIHFEKIPKTPIGKIHIDRYQKCYFLVNGLGKNINTMNWVVSLGEIEF